MNYLLLLRIILFFAVSGTWYAGLWLIAGVLTVVYVFRYDGYEIVFLGLLLDIQFMTGMIPWYTFAFTGAFIIAQWCKLRLLAYTN